MTRDLLKDLGDVLQPTPFDGATLVYNSTTGKWELIQHAGEVRVTMRHHARLFHTATQSVANAGGGTTLAFNEELWDNPYNDQHSKVTNNSRLTCVQAGLYNIHGNVDFAVSAGGARAIWLLVTFAIGGTAIIALDQKPTGSATDATRCLVSTTYRLSVNDYVELVAYQTSGAALNVFQSGQYSPVLGFAWLGP